MMSITRRLTAAVIALLWLCTMLPTGLVSAEALVSPDGYQYRIKADGTATIVGYTGDDTMLTVPATVDGCTVTEIAVFCFRGNTTLREITIPATVTVLGDAAFADCTALEVVCLPDGITDLRFLTFRDCTALKELVLPAALTSIDNTAFKNCTALGTVYYRGDAASRDAMETGGAITALSQATWYYGATRGVCGAWIYAAAEDSTAVITRYTADTPDVYVPSVLNGHAVTAIGSRVFSNKLTLKTVTVSRGVEVLYDRAFSGCTALHTVTLPDTVTTIGDRAFASCKSLAAVTLPDTLTAIGRAAFSDCDSFDTFCIPDSVTSLGAEAFSDCDALQTVTFPAALTALPDELFANCTALQHITLPAAVTEIGNGLLFGCTTLESVVLPNGITRIGDETFEGCTALQTVTFPATLEEIGKSAFYGCEALRTVTMPDSVTVVRERAFEGCTALTSIGFSANLLLIETDAFCNCTALKQVTLPDLLYILGDGAFRGCTALRSAVLPRYLDTLRYGTFYGCTALHRVTLPPSLTTIEFDAFSACTSLCDIALPASLTSVDTAFRACDALKTIYYADSEAVFQRVEGTATLPADATIVFDTAPVDFPDIDDTAWYRAAADHVSVRGWMTGFGDGRFGGAAPCERQDLVLMLARIKGAALDAYADGTGDLTDVVVGSYYAPAVAWGVEHGMIAGYQNGAFGVGDAITREQLCTILYRAAGSPPVERAAECLAAFPDGDRVSAFATDACAWAVQEGVVSGMADGRLAPVGYASRAQVATVLMRAV